MLAQTPGESGAGTGPTAVIEDRLAFVGRPASPLGVGTDLARVSIGNPAALPFLVGPLVKTLAEIELLENFDHHNPPMNA